jgi:hypothetical protein
MSTPALRLEFPDFDGLRDEFKKLPKGLSARTQGAAVGRAMRPALAALKGLTPRGPTGNLQRAAKLVTKRYPATGTGVAIVGYQKAGTGKKVPAQKGGRVMKGAGRAFHQFWIEFGTGVRAIKTSSRLRRNSIASSFNSQGFFVVKKPGVQPGRKGFFASAKRGQVLLLGAVHPQRPIAGAFAATKGVVSSKLEAELRIGIVGAYKQLEKIAAKKAAKAAGG